MCKARTDASFGARVGASPGDRGSVPVQFALIAPLVALLGIGVLQVGLFLHVRSIAATAAAEGARRAAMAGASASAGVAETRRILGPQGPARGAVVTASRVSVSGLPMIVVRVRMRVPLAGWIAPVTVQVTGHSVLEGVR